MQFSKLSHKSILVTLAGFLYAGNSWAQAEEAPAEEPTEAPEEEPAEAPPVEEPVEEPVAEEEAPAEEPMEEPPVEEPMEEEAPAEEPAAEAAPSPINFGVWGRVDLVLSNGDALDDISSSGVFELHTSGNLIPMVNFTANFVAGYNPDIAGNAALLDGIIQFDLHDAFHLWAGRMLVPVDRSNFSGPWFMAPWFYPGFGFADGQVTAPREGPSGRNDGVTAWGYFLDGMIKYYAGVFDLYDVTQNPLYSGRINISLINPEPGFYSNSMYLGKDILAIGVGAQAKSSGSVGVPAVLGDPAPTDDYFEVNADILFEKDLGSAGVLDLEGAVYYFDGDYEPTELGWMGVATYLIPGKIGPGQLQPNVRVQQAIPRADGADTSTLIDGQLGYLLDGFNMRMALGYRYGVAGDLSTQAVFLGAQFLK